MREFIASGEPAPMERSIGLFNEFARACKGGDPAGANFNYAGPLTEVVLLGNLAIRTKERIKFDPEALITNGNSDVVTFDHEGVEPGLLSRLEADGVKLAPAAGAKLHAQDKLHARRALAGHGFPMPDFSEAIGIGEFDQFAAVGLVPTLTSGVFLQVAFNVVLLVPLGVFLAYRYRRGFGFTVMAGLAVSLAIELTQGKYNWL